MRNQILLLLIFVSLSCVQSLTYNKAESLDYLYYEKASYCPKGNITRWQCGEICDFHSSMKDIRVFFNETHAAQGYFGYDKNTIIIAFRGSTRTLTNWLYNFDIPKTTYANCQGCSVHSGFYKTYMDIQEQLFNILPIYLNKHKNKNIIITGHSLGGALATIAAIEIQNYLTENNFSNVIKEVHTFGSPRVGNAQFAEFYNTLIPQTIRVVHNKDIVPHAPPALLGFLHVGTEIWLQNESNDYKVCQPFVEDKNCSSSVKKPSITDHVNYLNNNTGCRYPNQKVVCVDDGDDNGDINQDDSDYCNHQARLQENEHLLSLKFSHLTNKFKQN